MSKQFVMTFSVPVSDNLFAQAKVITAVEQAIEAFKGSLNGMDGYELTTELIARRRKSIDEITVSPQEVQAELGRVSSRRSAA